MTNTGLHRPTTANDSHHMFSIPTTHFRRPHHAFLSPTTHSQTLACILKPHRSFSTPHHPFSTPLGHFWHPHSRKRVYNCSYTRFFLVFLFLLVHTCIFKPYPMFSKSSPHHLFSTCLITRFRAMPSLTAYSWILTLPHPLEPPPPVLDPHNIISSTSSTSSPTQLETRVQALVHVFPSYFSFIFALEMCVQAIVHVFSVFI